MPPKKYKCNDDSQSVEKWSFEINVPYEFTLNLNDYFQYISGEDLLARYGKCRKIIQTLFRESELHYVLVPEISMPQYGDKHKNYTPRIHFHGVVVFSTIKSIQSWLLKDAIQYAKYGRYQFNPYRPDYWTKYCLKDKHLFEDLGPNYLMTNAFGFAEDYGFK